MSRWQLNQAVRIIKAGGVIAYPTEAVYGLGCLPEDFHAVSRILEMKHRPIAKGLILVATDVEQLERYIEFPDETVRQRVLETWPGPVTWVLPARPQVPVWIRGNHDSVAVRVSNHGMVRRLCTRTGPLVSTSANPSNRPPARSALKVMAYFGQSLDYILPGAIGSSRQASEIRDAKSGRILRSGG